MHFWLLLKSELCFYGHDLPHSIKVFWQWRQSGQSLLRCIRNPLSMTSCRGLTECFAELILTANFDLVLVILLTNISLSFSHNLGIWIHLVLVDQLSHDYFQSWFSWQFVIFLPVRASPHGLQESYFLNGKCVICLLFAPSRALTFCPIFTKNRKDESYLYDYKDRKKKRLYRFPGADQMCG